MGCSGLEIRSPVSNGIRDSEAKLHGRRSDDHFLMVSFVRASFHGNDLTRLNICRMFLHAITLADICTIDRTLITSDAWLGTRNPCSNSESWPRVQQQLPPSSWDLWQRALRACFTNRSSRVLYNPLGCWLRFPDRWVWHYYSPAEDRLYKQEGLMWRSPYLPC